MAYRAGRSPPACGANAPSATRLTVQVMSSRTAAELAAADREVLWHPFTQQQGWSRASVEGNPVEFQANVIDEIGKDEEGRSIDVLFGAIAMQLWGIKLDVPAEKLDLTHLTHDFVEFTESLH